MNQPDSDGYVILKLSLDGVTHSKKAHRLVALAFIPNPHNKPTVNHIDGCKWNNTVNNLEWASYTENNEHARRLGLNPAVRVLNRAVRQYVDGVCVNTFKSTADASKYTGVPTTNIWRACNGTRKTAGGYVWKYVEEGGTSE